CGRDESRGETEATGCWIDAGPRIRRGGPSRAPVSAQQPDTRGGVSPADTPSMRETIAEIGPLDNPCQYSRGVLHGGPTLVGPRRPGVKRPPLVGRLGDDAQMPRLQRKSLSAPDLVRTFPFGHVDIINLDETSVARFKWEPGWRWSKDVKPVVQTDSCQNRHVGYVISGALHVVMEDGTEVEITAGDAFESPPGHDAWVVGDEVWDTVEFTSAAVFGATPDENETVLSTILFTDIVDSTATLSRVGDAAWRRLLHQH